jgi:hypothetical protein
MHSVYLKEITMHLMMKPIGIDSIFETSPSESGQIRIITDNALLYQDILRYSLNLQEHHRESNGRFRIRELARWLIQNHEKYLKEYGGSHMNVSNRIEARLDTIKAKANDLVKLLLIKNVRTAEQSKGSGVVDIFAFTPHAYFFAWLAESFEPKNRARANKQIFKVLVDSMLKIEHDSTSSTIFYSNFYKKCEERGRFDDMVEFFREPLIIGVPIITVHDYFNYVTGIENMYMDVSGYFLGLIDETMEELDPKVSDLAMYQIKLDYERTMRANAKNPSSYEKTRFDCRNMHDAIVTESYCEKCHYYIPVAIKYHEYTKLAKKASTIVLGNNRCPNCRAVDSLIIQTAAFPH